MTLQEIDEMAIIEPYCFENEQEEQWYKVGLREGADAAIKQLGWHLGSERPLPATGKKIIVYYKDSDGANHAHTSFLNNLYEWFGVPKSVGDNLMWCYPPKED